MSSVKKKDDSAKTLSEIILSESIRKDMSSVIISLLSEDFLRSLFGQPMYLIHGRRSQATWRKILNKIIKILERSINQNVITDGFHISRLNRYIKLLKNACKSKNITDIDIILWLTGIILELLGGVPDYKNRGRINRNDDYVLNDFRMLQYSQTLHQKMLTILEASRYKPYCDYHKHDELVDTCYHTFHDNPTEFIQWYKDNYPDVYLKLF